MAEQVTAAVTDRKKRSAASRVLWCLKWLVICLMLAELFLRLVLGLGHPILFARDAACGYVVAPNQDLRRLFCLNQTNAQSMRSPPVLAVKPPGEFRVLFVGDSVTYGQTFTTQADIFTSILARRLPGQLHRPVEVLNASAGGWAVANELGYLQSRGTFEADLVVMVINSADLTQSFNTDLPGLFPQFPDHNPPSALSELWDRYIKHMIFHVRVADRGSTITPQLDGAQPVGATLAQLDEARLISERSHARFAIVYSPMLDADGNLAPDPDGALTILKQWAQRTGVPILDLTPAYSAASTKVVLRDAAHLTPRGNRIVAASIEQWQELTRYTIR
ncbi:MAG TPA: SGNH/GDSL hydrolase family protein [Tepidisphaeraceae bacterium]|jgi:lysophospholipase L1-like esterase|nr:SGNH/GDSL hydrolase family protein [Tepidisphaeraceae bacterium]